MSTKEKIIQAFFDLLTVKDFLDINVSELCKIAKVHRTTFYAYYDNLFELLKDAKEYAIEMFTKEMNISVVDDYLSLNVLIPYLNFVKKYSKLFKAYFINAAALESEKDFEHIYKTFYLKRALEKEKDVDEWKIRKITEFFMYGIAGTLSKWLENGCQEEPERIAEIISAVRNLNV